MQALRRVGVLTVALAGLGLLGSGVSGVAALDKNLKSAVQPHPRHVERGVMVLDCPKQHAAPAEGARVPS